MEKNLNRLKRSHHAACQRRKARLNSILNLIIKTQLNYTPIYASVSLGNDFIAAAAGDDDGCYVVDV